MTRLTPKNIEIRSLALIARDALPPIPDSMEARLLEEPELEPAIILFHPQAEVYVFVRLTDAENIQQYVDELNVAVLKQAMGEAPEDEGYRIDR